MQLAENFDLDYDSSALKSDFRDPKVKRPTTYEQVFFPTLKQSNATQNIYFSNYIEWQGAVREKWFFDCIDNQMLGEQGVFVTKTVHQNYIREGFPFQSIICTLNSFKIQKCSFHLLFRFYIEGELTSLGYQQIVFTNHNKKIAKLPDWAMTKIKDYEIQQKRIGLEIE